ncbi:MAG TPA: ABC transporter ATP-binding protein, partial [Bryobacteraceae bacterium]|nr:ABC transporter ATP-binding protein [Bryobacteraceae bacterium]
MTGALGFRILTAVVPVSMLWVAKYIIDDIAATIQHPGYVPPDIWWLVAAEFLLGAFGNILGRAVDYCEARLADQFSREVSLRIMNHAATLDLASFEDPTFYDVLERARVQATDRVILLHALGTLIQQAITLVSLSVTVIWYTPLLFLVLLISVIPAFLGESHMAFLGYSLAYSLTPIRRELDYLRTLATSKEAAKEVKIFGLAPYFRDQFATITDGVIRRTRNLQKKRFRFGSMLGMIGSVGYYAGYAYLVSQAIKGRLTIGDLQLLAGALAGSNTQLQAVFSTFAGIADQSLFLTDLVKFFAVEPKIGTSANGIPAPRPIRDGFEFRNVTFRYPQTDRLVLKDLNFRIAPGERVAVVGENGQGKTTFVKLLARLYDPSSGQILLDGVDLREYRLEDLHRQIGVIFQDFMRYDLPARENIGVGQIDQLANEDRLLAAARQSRASEIIQRFPDGLEQMLGRRFEGGVDLSGGEWQKFALARAYL